jgi:Skp family chaperone for outer membrane proteins
MAAKPPQASQEIHIPIRNLDLVRSFKHRMNRTLIFATALAASLASSTLVAQAPAAPAHTAAPAAPAAAIPPEAIPAKIAIIAFEQAVVATNEGERAVQEVQKKYEPKKAQLDALNTEIESLQKQLQALPANTPDEERASRLRAIDVKQKQLQRDGEDASNAYNADVQEAFAKVAQKVGATAVKYCQANGFTMLLNEGGQQNSPSPILWFEQKTDITQAVVNAYNLSSGVAAPPPSAPAPHRTPAAPAAHH